MPHVNLWLFIKFLTIFIFLIIFCHVLGTWCDALVPRDKILLRVSVTTKCHGLDFNLIPTYVYLFKFNPNICHFDSIYSWFFFSK